MEKNYIWCFAIVMVIVLIGTISAFRASDPREYYTPDNSRYRKNDQSYFNIPELSLVKQGIISVSPESSSRNYYPGRGVMGQIFFS